MSVDPEAAHRVFAAGLALELVPLDATRQAMLPRAGMRATLARTPGRWPRGSRDSASAASGSPTATASRAWRCTTRWPWGSRSIRRSASGRRRASRLARTARRSAPVERRTAGSRRASTATGSSVGSWIACVRPQPAGRVLVVARPTSTSPSPPPGCRVWARRSRRHLARQSRGKGRESGRRRATARRAGALRGLRRRRRVGPGHPRGAAGRGHRRRRHDGHRRSRDRHRAHRRRRRRAQSDRRGAGRELATLGRARPFARGRFRVGAGRPLPARDAARDPRARARGSPAARPRHRAQPGAGAGGHVRRRLAARRLPDAERGEAARLSGVPVQDARSAGAAVARCATAVSAP